MNRDDDRRVLVDDDGKEWRWTREQLDGLREVAIETGDIIQTALVDEAILLMTERDESRAAADATREMLFADGKG